MGKKLSEMSMEELWQLFPVFLTEHQACWTEWFAKEEAVLKNILSQIQIKRISHIGSTAIDAIWAKPVIDILVEISVECAMESVNEKVSDTKKGIDSHFGCAKGRNKQCQAFGMIQSVKDLLVKSGYLCMSQSEKRISLNKGYTEDGFAERVYHLHLRYAGDNDELYFRDYLIEYPDIARKYEKLTLGLWKKYEHNRDAYTQAKTQFVNKYTQLAKQVLI